MLPKHPHIHTSTHYKTHTYRHSHITKQVTTTTVQDTHETNVRILDDQYRWLLLERFGVFWNFRYFL